YNVPEKDTTLYNFKQRAAFISHGGLIENISLSAPTFGYSANIDYFPDNSNPNLTAKIGLIQTEKIQPPLFSFIKKRHTNRKTYQDKALTDEQKNKLSNIFNDSKDVSVYFIEEPADVEKAAFAISQGDRLIFENKTIHDFLFDHIRWHSMEE